MKAFDVLTAGVLSAAVVVGSDAVLAEPPQRKPNIVVIMSDDVGWTMPRMRIHSSSI